MYPETNQFLELLRPEYNDALKYCKALCAKRSVDDAEDVLQQSLLKALENIGNLKDQTKFRSWFFKIITREFFNFIRKDFWKRFIPITDNNSLHNIPEIFDREDDENEMKLFLNTALSKISAKERSAVLLFEIGGFSIEDIRDIQNEKSISAIKSRLSRARGKLKKLIRDQENNISKPNNRNSINLGDLNHETIKLTREIEAK